MAKPTHASVTEEPCTCDYLQNAADDPGNPIVFDAQTAEYQFSYDDGAMLVIYHCPFCGGAAPESKRALLFEQIPEAEQERLGKLLHGITTIDAAIKKFGKPDFEGVSTSKHPERQDKPPRIEHHRDIRYHNLSDIAEIWITERPDGSIYWHLQGKYIGRNVDDGAEPNCTERKRPWWRFWG
jgi:hypothetical protein